MSIRCFSCATFNILLWRARRYTNDAAGPGVSQNAQFTVALEACSTGIVSPGAEVSSVLSGQSQVDIFELKRQFAVRDSSSIEHTCSVVLYNAQGAETDRQILSFETTAVAAEQGTDYVQLSLMLLYVCLRHDATRRCSLTLHWFCVGTWLAQVRRLSSCLSTRTPQTTCARAASWTSCATRRVLLTALPR